MIIFIFVQKNKQFKKTLFTINPNQIPINMSSDDLELIPIDKFDSSRLRFSVPKTVTSKDGLQYMRCDVKYNSPTSEKDVTVLLEAPEEFTFGFQHANGFGGNKKDDPNSFNICYFLASSEKDNVGKQTVEQIAFCNTLKSIEKTLQKHFEQNKEHLSEKAEQLVQTKKYVKEIKTYPKKPVEKGNRKVDDTTKPPRMYLPLMITKNGKCLTNIYNEHDEVFDFHSILDVRGVIKPIIKFDYVYISDTSASCQFKLWECAFKSTGLAQRKRLVGTIVRDVKETSNPSDDLDDQPTAKPEPRERDNTDRGNKSSHKSHKSKESRHSKSKRDESKRDESD